MFPAALNECHYRILPLLSWLNQFMLSNTPNALIVSKMLLHHRYKGYRDVHWPFDSYNAWVYGFWTHQFRQKLDLKEEVATWRKSL